MAPLVDEVFGGVRPVGEVEMKAGFEKTTGDYAAAFEDEFGFGAHEKRCQFEEEAGCGDAIGHLPGFPQRGHEVAIAFRVGRCDVDRPFEVFAISSKLIMA